MVLNLILLVAGAALLIFGIKTKLKMWIIIGLFLMSCGAVSAFVDYKTGGMDVNTSRLPFVIDKFM